MKSVRNCSVLAIIVATSAFISGCATNANTASIPFKELPQSLPAEVVLFVPGFKGVELRSVESKDTEWVTASQVIFGGGTLAVPRPELALDKPGKKLEPVKVLLGVKAFFGLYTFNVYGDALKNLKEALPPGMPIVELDYDWRNSIDEAAKQMADVVAALKARGVQRIDVVSHSMGGLVTWYYMRYGGAPIESAKENWAGAHEVHSVVFSGAPFRGSMKIFHDLQTGSRTGLNGSLLSADALSTFDSSYELLPGPDQESLLSEDLSSQDGEMHDVRNWEEQEWGLLKDKADLSENALNNRYSFTEQELSRSAEFANLMTSPRVTPMPALPVLVISGTGIPTMARSVWVPENKQLLFKTSDLRKSVTNASDPLARDGDGIVTYESSLAPSAIAKEDYVVNKKMAENHLSIINVPEAATIIARFILEKK